MSDKKIPKDYFKNLPDKILQKLSKEGHELELREHSKLLHTIPKNNPYKVPQSYFDELVKRNIKSYRPKVRKLWPMIASIAACAIILVTMLNVIHDTGNEILDTDILDYYAENVQEVNTDVLLDLVYEEELDEEIDIQDIELEEIISSLSDYELELFQLTF